MEQALERFQQGGFINGDYIVIKKTITNSPYFKELPTQSQEYIKNCIASDLRMRVSAIKSIRPALQQVDGGLNAGGDFVVDVVVEYAPGLYKNPLTLPVQYIELVAGPTDGFGTLDAPDSLKRKDKVHGPEDLPKKQMLPTSNTVLPNSNKHPDDQPGGVKAGLYMKDHKAGRRIAESVQLEDVYDCMLNEQPDNLTPEQEPVVNKLLDKGFRINKISHKFAEEEGGPTVYMGKRVGGGMTFGATIEPNGMVNGDPVDAFLGDLESESESPNEAPSEGESVSTKHPDWQVKLRKAFEKGDTGKPKEYIMHQKAF